MESSTVKAPGTERELLEAAAPFGAHGLRAANPELLVSRTGAAKATATTPPCPGPPLKDRAPPPGPHGQAITSNRPPGDPAMAYLPSMPDASLMQLFQRHPELAVPLHDFAEALMRGPSSLSPAERELIAAYVSALNHCDFCTRSHAAVMAAYDVDPALVEQLIADPDGAPVDDRLRPLLGYVRRLNDAPHGIAQGDVDTVLAAGWDEAALMYANVICGFFNLMNRWVDGTGVAADPEAVAGAARFLREQGYGGVGRLLAR